MICDACQKAIAVRARRGPLTVTGNPPQVYYKGLRLDLSPAQARLMFHLVRFGEGGYGPLCMISTGLNVEAPMDQLRVVICHLRKRLPPGVGIRSRYGWGYELVIA